MAGDALGLATVKRALTGADVVIQSLGVAAGLEAILNPGPPSPALAGRAFG